MLESGTSDRIVQWFLNRDVDSGFWIDSKMGVLAEAEPFKMWSAMAAASGLVVLC